jgi:phenylacetate-CoA ligase
MKALLPLYQRLPPPFRHIAASVRGYQLIHERYGTKAEEMVAEVLERDNWSANQWKTWRENRLAYMLHRAATTVPYYQEQWMKRRRQGDRSSYEDINNWPIITKDQIRKNARAFVANDCSIDGLILDRTGGTTGTPLNIWLSQETQQQSYAIFEARARRWNGVTRHKPWGTLGGQIVIPSNITRPPFWVHNYPMHQIYLSSGHISRETTPYYTEALKRHHTTHVIAYTASITYLARQISELGLDIPSDLKLIITNAEGLYQWQRETIKKGLDCEAVQTYGMVELVACGSEKNGKLYQWPEYGIIEIFQDDADFSVEPGTSGRFICTGLINTAMPLIRYDVGDRGTISCVPETTPTMAYPIITSIEGRKTEMLITHEGRRVWYFNPLFSGLPVFEAQIVQESLNQIRILYVPSPSFTDNDKETILKRLYQRMGTIEVYFEFVERIPREVNGKFKLVVNNVPIEDRIKIGDVIMP